MIRSLRKLWKDRRGNALVIAGAALPIVVGGAGLATDTIQWVLWKRELQRAADSAAIAGVNAKAQSETVSTAITADLNENNNHTGNSLLSGYPQIAYPADSGSFSNQVQVTLAIQKSLGFSSLFLSTAPTITATATAAEVPALNPCAWALNNTTSPAVTIGGSSSTNLGCPVMSDSTGNPAVTTNGSNYTFTAPTVAGVGSLPSSINGVTTLLPHYLSQSDPYAGKYSTSLPSGCNEKNLNQNTYTTTTGTGQNKVTTTHLYSYETKGVCYSNFKFTGGVYYLDAGTYYLDSTNFDTTGGTTLYGTGVTIILTGSTPGSVTTNGNSTIQLSAPTSGTYKNMLFIQSSSATLNNGNTINGDSNSKLDGTIYMPRGQLSFSGSSADTTKCLQAIGWTLNFTGNTNIQNNTTGCTASTTSSTKAVRLVA
jgi:Flp pilus assembly protein TadG